MTIKRDKPPSQTYYEASPLMIVHVRSHLIETTALCDDYSAGQWVQSALTELRHLTWQGRPLIVGLCGFRGLLIRYSWNLKGPQRNPNHPSNPCRTIAFCLGGSRVLFYQLESYYWRNNARCIRPLRDLLDDLKVAVVGWGVKEIAKKLDSEWGLKVFVILSLFFFLFSF